jgi:hypothetical protein
MHQAILLGPFIFYYTEQNKLTLEKETIDFTYSKQRNRFANIFELPTPILYVHLL